MNSEKGLLLVAPLFLHFILQYLYAHVNKAQYSQGHAGLFTA